jgi:hypothetical protein
MAAHVISAVQSSRWARAVTRCSAFAALRRQCRRGLLEVAPVDDPLDEEAGRFGGSERSQLGTGERPVDVRLKLVDPVANKTESLYTSDVASVCVSLSRRLLQPRDRKVNSEIVGRPSALAGGAAGSSEPSCVRSEPRAATCRGVDPYNNDVVVRGSG